MTKVIDIVREILDLPKKVDDVHYHNHHFAFAVQIDMSMQLDERTTHNRSAMCNAAHSNVHYIQSIGARPAISLLGLAHEVTFVAIATILLFRLMVKTMDPQAKTSLLARDAPLPGARHRRRIVRPALAASKSILEVRHRPEVLRRAIQPSSATREDQRSMSMAESAKQTRLSTRRRALLRLELRAALDLSRAALPSRTLSSGSLFYANVVGNMKQSKL